MSCLSIVYLLCITNLSRLSKLFIVRGVMLCRLSRCRNCLVNGWQISINVLRYVALVQIRSGMRFCRYVVEFESGFSYLFITLAKTMTPSGSPRRWRGSPVSQAYRTKFQFSLVVLAGRQWHIPTCCGQWVHSDHFLYLKNSAVQR